MEYEYTRDNNERPVAFFSSGHSAFGRWLTEEIGEDLTSIDAVLEVIVQLEQKTLFEKVFSGKDFLLTLDREQVVISAHNLSVDPCKLDENEEEVEYQGTSDFYDSELRAECGLTDFKAALLGWQDFLKP